MKRPLSGGKRVLTWVIGPQTIDIKALVTPGGVYPKTLDDLCLIQRRGRLQDKDWKAETVLMGRGLEDQVISEREMKARVWLSGKF
jgi:hypothetical protein